MSVCPDGTMSGTGAESSGAPTTTGLTADDRARYVDQGFLSPITLMSPQEMADHRARLEAAEARLGPLHYKVKPYLLFSSPWELGHNPVLLDAVASLISADVLLWDSAYVIKEPHTQGRVSWHQDLTYWGLSSDAVVTAWVAIADATPENGCMMMLPGSHKRGRQRHLDTHAGDNLLHRGQTLDLAIDEAKVVMTPLKAGQASLHGGWTAHASQPNRSATRRIGLTLQYVATSMRQLVGRRETATLVRGVDRYGHFEREPPFDHDFDPAMLAYQAEVERLKREVYDTA